MGSRLAYLPTLTLGCSSSGWRLKGSFWQAALILGASLRALRSPRYHVPHSQFQ